MSQRTSRSAAHLDRSSRVRLLMVLAAVVMVVGTAWAGPGLGGLEARREMLRVWLEQGGNPALQFPMGYCGSGTMSLRPRGNPAGAGDGEEIGRYWQVLEALTSTPVTPAKSFAELACCSPLDSVLAYVLGGADLQSGKQDLALERWSQSGAAARFLQVGTRCQQADSQLSRSYYDLALATAGEGDAAVLESLIWIYSGVDAPIELEKALAMYQRVGDGSSSRFFLTVGRGQMALAVSQDAIESFRRAADLDPESWTPLYWAGMAYSQVGRQDQALEMYRRALNLEPGEGIVMVRIGDSLYAQGDRNGAYAWYDRASAIDSSAARAVASMCRLRLDQKRFTEAMGLADRLLELDPRAYAWELASRAAEGIGDIRNAQADMVHALELDPGNDRYMERLIALCVMMDGVGCPESIGVDGGG